MSNIVLIETEGDIITIRGDGYETWKMRVPDEMIASFEEWARERRGVFVEVWEDGTIVFSPSGVTILPVGPFADVVSGNK
jgi:hypothetical protein